MALCRSWHQCAEFIWNRTTTKLGCHRYAFNWFGGVPGRMIISHVKCASPKLCINYPTAPMLKKTRRHPRIILTQLINASRTLSPISAIVSGRWVFNGHDGSFSVLAVVPRLLQAAIVRGSACCRYSGCGWGPLLDVNRAARHLAGVTIKGVLGGVAKISRSARGRQRKSVGEYRQINRLWQRESSAPRHRRMAHQSPRDLKESPTNGRDAMLLPSLPQGGVAKEHEQIVGDHPKPEERCMGAFLTTRHPLHPKTDLSSLMPFSEHSPRCRYQTRTSAVLPTRLLAITWCVDGRFPGDRPAAGSGPR